jgi:hypothetical protein
MRSGGLTLAPGFKSTVYSESWAIYIDYNQDGTFDVVTEKAYGGWASSKLQGSFLIPATAKLGATRMRVAMSYGVAPGTCKPGTYGETEDYTLQIVG